MAVLHETAGITEFKFMWLKIPVHLVGFFDSWRAGYTIQPVTNFEFEIKKERKTEIYEN